MNRTNNTPNKLLKVLTIMALATSLLFINAENGNANINNRVGYWPLDNIISGGVVPDSSGQGNHGNATGGSATVDRFGTPNAAYEFNGISDFIRVGPAADVVPENSPFTLSVWIKPDDVSGDRNTFLSCEADNQGYGLWFIPEAFPGLEMGLYGAVGDDDPVTQTGVDNVFSPEDIWTHVAMTWSQSGGIQVYVDGVLRKTKPQSQWSYPTIFPTSLFVGADQGASVNTPSTFFDGSIDDVAIYDVELTPEQIRELAGPPTIAHWSFDTESIIDSTALDISVHGYDAKIIGATPSAESFTGSRSLLFNGINDFLTTPLIPVYENTNSFTWEAIVKFPTINATGPSRMEIVGFEKSLQGGVAIVVDSDADPNETGFVIGFARSDGWQSDPSFQLGERTLSTDPDSYDDTGWHHFAFIRDRDAELYKLYVDGTLVAFGTDENNNIINDVLKMPLLIGTNGGTERFFEGYIDEIRISNAALNPEDFLSATAPSVTVAIDRVFGAPGDTLRVGSSLTNPSSTPAGGLQFTVILDDPIDAHFIGLEDSLSNPGFTVSTTTAGDDSTRLVVFSGSNAVIQPGTDILLATLVYTIDPSATLGSTVPLTVTGVEIGDSSGVALPDSAVDGHIQIGIRGDLDLSGNVSILDIIKLVRQIIGADPALVPGSTAFNIADMNGDGSINIIDVILQVRTILGIATKPLAVGPTTPAVVRPDAVQTLPDGQLVIPVMLVADGVVAGAQATFTFNPMQLQVGTPQIVGDATGLSIDSHVVDGTLRVVVYGMMPGSGIAAGHNTFLHIPVTVREGVTGTPSLTLADILLVDPQAQRVPVTMGETIVTVTKDGAVVPTTFALDNARPNPFNPSTTISYEVPKQGHIKLTVYNLLGQEVVRLVDQVMAPGRYTAIWNGVNARGHGVASGIYMYRLTSSTGFTETKRMTLLK